MASGRFLVEGVKVVRYEIRRLKPWEVEAAMALAWEVFLQFEAPEYSDEGVETFRRDIVENGDFLRRCREGICPLYGAFDGETLVSMMGMRGNRTHINLVFTKREYQRKGLASAVFRRLLDDLSWDDPPPQVITLNSSPYGLPFYLALGFVPAGEEQEENGIRYTPMKYEINQQRSVLI